MNHYYYYHDELSNVKLNFLLSAEEEKAFKNEKGKKYSSSAKLGKANDRKSRSKIVYSG